MSARGRGGGEACRTCFNWLKEARFNDSSAADLPVSESENVLYNVRICYSCQSGGLGM